MDEKTKSTIKKVGFGVVILGGVLACVGGATLDEVSKGGVIAFGIVEVIAGAIVFVFGK